MKILEMGNEKYDFSGNGSKEATMYQVRTLLERGNKITLSYMPKDKNAFYCDEKGRYSLIIDENENVVIYDALEEKILDDDVEEFTNEYNYGLCIELV